MLGRASAAARRTRGVSAGCSSKRVANGSVWLGIWPCRFGLHLDRTPSRSQLRGTAECLLQATNLMHEGGRAEGAPTLKKISHTSLRPKKSCSPSPSGSPRTTPPHTISDQSLSLWVELLTSTTISGSVGANSAIRASLPGERGAQLVKRRGFRVIMRLGPPLRHSWDVWPS